MLTAPVTLVILMLVGLSFARPTPAQTMTRSQLHLTFKLKVEIGKQVYRWTVTEHSIDSSDDKCSQRAAELLHYAKTHLPKADRVTAMFACKPQLSVHT